MVIYCKLYSIVTIGDNYVLILIVGLITQVILKTKGVSNMRTLFGIYLVMPLWPYGLLPHFGVSSLQVEASKLVSLRVT